MITMAPPNTVTGVPRSILPRLIWNGTFPRVTTAFSTARPQHSHQRMRSWDPLARPLHALSFSPHSSRLLTTAAAAASTSREIFPTTRRSSFSSSRPSIEPVRYNGVYVATFKPARRAFHATPSRGRDHHFDTLKFVQRLKNEGYSEEQAVAMMRVLNDVIQESIQNLTRTMVLREGQWIGSFFLGSRRQRRGLSKCDRGLYILVYV